MLNLNVPSVPPDELRGVRRGRISTAGIIKSAAERPPPADRPVVPWPGQSATRDEGEIRLTLGTAVPSLGDVEG